VARRIRAKSHARIDQLEEANNLEINFPLLKPRPQPIVWAAIRERRV
jgi:hypothetical protein